MEMKVTGESLSRHCLVKNAKANFTHASGPSAVSVCALESVVSNSCVGRVVVRKKASRVGGKPKLKSWRCGLARDNSPQLAALETAGEAWWNSQL